MVHEFVHEDVHEKVREQVREFSLGSKSVHGKDFLCTDFAWIFSVGGLFQGCFGRFFMREFLRFVMRFFMVMQDSSMRFFMVMQGCIPRFFRAGKDHRCVESGQGQGLALRFNRVE